MGIYNKLLFPYAPIAMDSATPLRSAQNDTRTLWKTQAVIARECSERGDPEQKRLRTHFSSAL